MLNNLKQALGTIIFTAVLTGCATTSKAPMSYNPEDSKALNIANAAGFGSQLKDAEVPADTLQTFTDSAGFGIGLAGGGYMAPIPGFSGLQMGTLNLLSAFFSPTPAAKRHSIIAWVPYEKAQDEDTAIEYLADALIAASEKAANELNLTVEKAFTKDKTGSGAYFREFDKDTGILFALRDPVRAHAPTFILPATAEKAWFFKPTKPVFSYFKVVENGDTYNEVDYLVKISSHLPSSVAFYVAPDKLRVDATKKLNFPVILHQGEVLYFVKAQKKSGVIQ
ncbi:MAG: hypothetical protein N0E42_12165 [Candidatus Thiodiazotropha endolucinida]|nr:hypothetical protein [Candidatus Thiodiazotropha taylori]MCW4225226.1 hypothetical protein [Candidatus Thiodiazotropha endolucinida]MCG7880778.1 hypothetical protein [Candidatus Thiodiazotropha taylori]MCG7886797.1 hypothetical protein [Candidatus Thiodiazotropha taylori]MCG8028184.1 hypothetical protein [Candidatus Thiodiazotropha taylori]